MLSVILIGLLQWTDPRLSTGIFMQIQVYIPSRHILQMNYSHFTYYHFVSMGIYPPNTAWSEYTISVQWQNLKTTKAHKCNKSPVKPFNPFCDLNGSCCFHIYTLCGNSFAVGLKLLTTRFSRSMVCIFELTAAHTQLWYHYSTCRSKLILSTSHLR